MLGRHSPIGQGREECGLVIKNCGIHRALAFEQKSCWMPDNGRGVRGVQYLEAEVLKSE